MTTSAGQRRVAVVTLGCARNEVDSEELAGRLSADGWLLVDEPSEADAVLVNTCGFVAAAKKDSIDTVLAAADLKGPGGPTAVVAVGCLAERYGRELAESLPEADAVLGFDAYEDIGRRLARIVAGEHPVAHVPQDRRRLLPLSPVERPGTAAAVPGHASGAPGAGSGVAGSGLAGGAPGAGSGVAGSGLAGGAPRPGVVLDAPDLLRAPAGGPRVVRRRLDGGPTAPLKLASGCDRRCTFCAIPSFRGSFLSRPPADVIAEAGWLAEQGVRELVLVSENSTSYGKDLGDLHLLEALLPELAAVPGIDRVRVSYLQPAETRDALIEVIATTPGVVPYFDLSFQHASATVLRRMRRFGGTDSFLALLDRARTLAPEGGARSNVIVGFPGETEADLLELERFLVAARLDAVGVFGYSDEEGTEAAAHPDKLPEDEIRSRVERVTELADELCAQRAEDRIGELVQVLVERVGDGAVEGRTGTQGPEVDGSTFLVAAGDGSAQVGRLGASDGAVEGRTGTPGPQVDGSTCLTTAAAGPSRVGSLRVGSLRVGDLVSARVTGSDGVDLVAEALAVLPRS